MIIKNEQALNSWVDARLGGVPGGVYRDDTQFCLKEDTSDRPHTVVAEIISIIVGDPIVLYYVDEDYNKFYIGEVPDHLVSWTA
jgi:hypothetical protein